MRKLPGEEKSVYQSDLERPLFDRLGDMQLLTSDSSKNVLKVTSQVPSAGMGFRTQQTAANRPSPAFTSPRGLRTSSMGTTRPLCRLAYLRFIHGSAWQSKASLKRCQAM